MNHAIVERSWGSALHIFRHMVRLYGLSGAREVLRLRLVGMRRQQTRRKPPRKPLVVVALAYGMALEHTALVACKACGHATPRHGMYSAVCDTCRQEV